MIRSNKGIINQDIGCYNMIIIPNRIYKIGGIVLLFIS